MISTADCIAQTVIQVSRDHGDLITNLKLQKLLYYTQAWHLALYEDALFPDSIEAWVHGPVVPSVFKRFRPYKWNVITEAVSPIDDESILAHVSEIFRVYGSFTATQLERLTHTETPWLEARIGLEPDMSSHVVITTDSMRRYFADKLIMNV